MIRNLVFAVAILLAPAMVPKTSSKASPIANLSFQIPAFLEAKSKPIMWVVIMRRSFVRCSPNFELNMTTRMILRKIWT